MNDDLLIYDGECPMCAFGARMTGDGGLRILPYQDPALPAGIDPAACRGEMKLVLDDGRIFSGAEALPRLLVRRPWTRPAAWILALPGAMALARAIYPIVSRLREAVASLRRGEGPNRRAIAPTARNVRFPADFYGETPAAIAAFLAVTVAFAILATAAYGASAARVLAIAPAVAAVHVTAAAAAGWALSLPLLLGLRGNRIAATDVLRQGACVMALGVLPLLPTAALNLLAPSITFNAVVLVGDGALMLCAMARRLQAFGLPRRLTILWFAALEVGGAAAWWLMKP